ncbi:MAG: fatty acid desaturase family protein [Chitinophagaceae bacterium]|nr:fatty acid desaturase family protein [Anaerolineae bacterium]
MSAVVSPKYPGQDFQDVRVKPFQYITREELTELSKIKHWNVIGHVALTWGLIFAALQAAIMIDFLPFDILAFVFIGCMQNGLISWTHEASHYSLTRNKKLNDRLADLFISGPAGATVAGYRQHHVLHHRYLGDPEKEIALEVWLCLKGGYLYSAIVRYMVGLNALRVIFRYNKKSDDARHSELPARSGASLIGFAVANALLIGICALQGQWYLFFLLWVAPLFTVALLVSNFRTIVEHQPSSDVCDTGRVQLPNMTRVIKSSWLERALIAPVGFYHHHEHHMYPGVPYHRLHEMRAILQKRGYFDRPEIVWGEGYLRTIWRLSREPGYGVRLLNPLHQFPHDEDDHDEAVVDYDFEGDVQN